ncbi:tetratricopeptide repeat protein [Niallia circulans]|nr:tetratricopeptide repeat protein [Niallia circulans]
MIMWFKRKSEKNKNENTISKKKLTEDQKEELLGFISRKSIEVQSLNIENQARVFEEIGLAYYELGDEENAIASLEKSLQLKKTIGESFKTLLKLYNKKRAEAAESNDADNLQTFLNKIDLLMQISKDVTRGVK